MNSLRTRPPGRGTSLVLLVLPALVATFAGGCGATRLRPQLEELSRFAQFTGRITGADAHERHLAVLVDEGGPAPRIVNYAFATESGAFVLLGRTGNLKVLAFADRDRDSVLDDDEPVGWAKVPATAGGSGVQVQIGEVALATDAPRPGFAVDLSVVGASGQQARTRRLGEIVTLDDPRFAAEIVSRGFWEPLRFAEESGLQILFTEAYDPARTPVVFVHGMQGSPRDFRTLLAGLDKTRFQAWLYYYPTGLDLDANGLFLRELLGELRQRLGFERLDVVAHSMGGLVSFSAIASAARDGADFGVERYITLSTPWQGAVGTRGMEAGMAMTPTTAPSWTDMLPSSAFLEQLAARPLPEGIHFSMLFGYSGNNAMVSGADDGTVAVRSMAPWTMVRQAEYVLPVACDHEGILQEGSVVEVVNRLLRGEPPTPGAAKR